MSLKPPRTPSLTTVLVLCAAFQACGQSPARVLVVENENSAVSKSIAGYYVKRRAIPLGNICGIRAPESEEIPREVYQATVAGGVADCLKSKGLVETVLYIVTTLGVPLKIAGSDGPGGDRAAVDSELTLLYPILKGRRFETRGGVPNPMFRQRDLPFRHPGVPMYMVTRLAGYGFDDVRRMIDRSLAAVNRGIVVLDLKSSSDETGNDWLRNAALLLPQNRVLLEETSKVVYGAKGVVGYASWGSNDPHRTERWLKFEWLPGAIATEFVSTDARTFLCPPESWAFSGWDAKDKAKWWAGSPQSLAADLIHEGATGASGHVYEPYLSQTPRPDLLFPAYLGGRNLAESFYLSIPALSWMNVVLGDPLCTLGKPR